MSNPLKALRQVFSRKSAKRVYEGKGEEFKYWQRYMMREKDKVRGPEIWQTLVGYRRKQDYEWYYDEHYPNSTDSQRKQGIGLKMPLVKPIKEWDIFLGDKRFLDDTFDILLRHGRKFNHTRIQRWPR